MEFPFSNYLGTSGTNRNGTISSPFNTGGPVLRGSGNMFWYPPIDDCHALTLIKGRKCLISRNDTLAVTSEQGTTV